MLFTKWYKITGITKEMYEANRDNFNPELIIWLDGDIVQARIMLNWFEARRLRKEVRKWNQGSEYKLHLIECTEKTIFKREENVEVEAL